VKEVGAKTFNSFPDSSIATEGLLAAPALRFLSIPFRIPDVDDIEVVDEDELDLLSIPFRIPVELETSELQNFLKTPFNSFPDSSEAL